LADKRIAFPKPGEAWLESAGDAQAAFEQGARVARLFGAGEDGFAHAADWSVGSLPVARLGGNHSGAGLLRPEGWAQALNFFHRSLRRTNPGGLAAVHGGLWLASLAATDLQGAVRRHEAAAFYDKQRGVQGLAVFGPGGPDGAAVLRFADGSPDVLQRLLTYVWRQVAGRGMTGVFASLPAEQARLVAAALPDWEPEDRRVLARAAPAA